MPQALHDVGLAAFFIFTGPLPGESFKRLRKMGCGFKPAQARYLFNGQAGCVQTTLRSVGASVHDILMDAYSNVLFKNPVEIVWMIIQLAAESLHRQVVHVIGADILDYRIHESRSSVRGCFAGKRDQYRFERSGNQRVVSRQPGLEFGADSYKELIDILIPFADQCLEKAFDIRRRGNLPCWNVLLVYDGKRLLYGKPFPRKVEIDGKHLSGQVAARNQHIRRSGRYVNYGVSS